MFKHHEHEEHEADLLIIGSGLGGCMAACVAAEAERDMNVAVISKSTLMSGGTAATGINGVLAFPPSPAKIFSSAGDLRRTWTPEEDIPKLWELYEEQAEGLLNKEMTKVHIDRSWELVKLLESFGIQMTSSDVGGEYMWTLVAGGVMRLVFEDSFVIQKKLGQHVMKHRNVTVFERCMTVDLLKKDGRVCGAIAFNIRTGRVVVVHSKAVILSTGAGFRLYENPTGVPYSARHSPYNTGDGQAMTLRAGGVLVSMEIPLWSSCPQGLMVPGVTQRSALGARWINALGERIMEKHYPEHKENVSRHMMARAIIEEYETGYGPVFLDITHLPEHIQDMMLKRWRPRTILEYFKSRNINLKEQPLEMVAHGDQAAPGGIGGGIMVNPNFETSLENLYAIGDCANTGYMFNGGFHMFGGMVAGEHVAKRSKGLILNKVDTHDISEVLTSVYEPLRRESGRISVEAVEHNLRKIMSTYVGYRRNEGGLSMAGQRITALKEVLHDTKVDDPHQLMKFFEVRNLLDCGEAIARSALLRRESRLVPSHYRVDYPTRDDTNWYGKRVAVRMENGIQNVYTVPVP